MPPCYLPDQVFHLEEVLQFMADYLEDAMLRTPEMLLTGINVVLSADVFARLADFIKYRGDDPYLPAVCSERAVVAGQHTGKQRDSRYFQELAHSVRLQYQRTYDALR